eukprot:jgi/Psemu1/15388/gm1.15388_g
MTVEELLVAKNILKDDKNPENLPEEKIQRPGIKTQITEILSGKEVDEPAKKRRIHREEEDKKNEEEAASETDPIAVATNPALQNGDTETIVEEKAAKATNPIENKEREENKTTWKEDKKNEEEAANDTDPIAVTTDPALRYREYRRGSGKTGRKQDNMERLFTKVGIMVGKMNDECENKCKLYDESTGDS